VPWHQCPGTSAPPDEALHCLCDVTVGPRQLIPQLPENRHGLILHDTPSVTQPPLLLRSFLIPGSFVAVSMDMTSPAPSIFTCFSFVISSSSSTSEGLRDLQKRIRSRIRLKPLIMPESCATNPDRLNVNVKRVIRMDSQSHFHRLLHRRSVPSLTLDPAVSFFSSAASAQSS
jgi:hypothetical protein